MTFFEGFALTQVAVSVGDHWGGDLRVRLGGPQDAPALLLLHGNPQTHVMWHATAPRLAERFRVVCPDLPGYGGSFKPPLTDDHAPYAKRAMAAALAALMEHLGHDTYDVVGHDRGARVAHRLALDFKDRVQRLAVLDIVPTLEHFERTDMAFAMGYYHWFWFAQRHPLPESVITAAPEAWFRAHVQREPKGDDFFHPDALADYLAHVRDPLMIRGMCEDYRAAATIDLDHDRVSRAAGDRIQCPLLVLWGAKGKIDQWYEPLDIWRAYADGDVSGGTIESGHYLAEEAPDEVLRYFDVFLR